MAVVSAQAVQFGLHIASLTILARLLTPEDYGMFSIVITFVVFGNLFRDMGLASATIQHWEIRQDQVSTLYGIQVLMGIVLAVTAAASGPAIAWFFHEPRLSGMMAVTGSVFALHGIMSLHQSLLRRRMQFVRLAVIDTAAMACGALAGILAAWKFQAGYWSLVISQVVIAIVTLAGVLLSSDWRPGPFCNITEIRGLVRFGSRITLVGFCNHLGRSVDNLLIGRFWGVRELSFYDKAYQMLLIPLMQIIVPISGMALPVLASLQNDPTRFRAYLQRMVTATATLGMAATAFLFVAADHAVLVILGPQWIPAIPIFRAMSPAAFLEALFAVSFWIPLSLGQGARLVKATLSVTFVTIIGFFFGLPWGAAGVATAYSVTRCLLLVPIMRCCCREAPITFPEMIRAVWLPAVASLFAAAAVHPFIGQADMEPFPALNLVLFTAMYTIIFASVWMLTPSGRRLYREAADLIWERPVVPAVSSNDGAD